MPTSKISDHGSSSEKMNFLLSRIFSKPVKVKHKSRNHVIFNLDRNTYSSLKLPSIDELKKLSSKPNFEISSMKDTSNLPNICSPNFQNEHHQIDETKLSLDLKAPQTSFEKLP